MHRCIAILGPAIRVPYRDPSIAILKKNTTAVGQGHQHFFKKYQSHMAFSSVCPFCCPHIAWIVPGFITIIPVFNLRLIASGDWQLRSQGYVDTIMTHVLQFANNSYCFRRRSNFFN